jgi:transposase
VEIKAEGIDHLGIVSGICDEINLVETIDKAIPQKSNMNISIGTRVKAMVLNAMGFTGRPLYLSHQFFQKKPLDLLLGPDITTSDLNDDALGRSLDELHKAGPELVYCLVAASAIKNYNIKIEKLHGDTTSISVQGEYNGNKNEGLIRFGYSKDRRKDLKQFILSSFATSDGGIPIFGSAVAGNTSDAKHFREVFQKLKENMIIDLDGVIIICDAAAYSKETIGLLQTRPWIFRVPDTINDTKTLKANTSNESFVQLKNGYAIFESISSYGDVEQRWILVRSEQAFDRAKKTITRSVSKEMKDLEAKIKKCKATELENIEVAEQTIAKLAIKTKYHIIKVVNALPNEKIPIRGVREKQLVIGGVKLSIYQQVDKIKQQIDAKSKFIVATNVLDDKKLPAESVLMEYKNQFKVEKGFRFLKNPLCMADSVYLKNERRIVALSMIMLITLLVYAIAERALRKALVERGLSVMNQVNKPVQNPTMRWVFQTMEDVIVLRYREDDKIIVKITNLTDELVLIIGLLGNQCLKRYLLGP